MVYPNPLRRNFIPLSKRQTQRGTNRRRTFSIEWATPDGIYKPMNHIFDFTLDAAASADNAKTALYFDRKINGLTADWSGHRVWINPPYDETLGAWVRRAHMSVTSREAEMVLMLLPARTGRPWFHDHCLSEACSRRFVRGRICFIPYDGAAATSAMEDSILCFFRDRQALGSHPTWERSFELAKLEPRLIT